MGGPFHGSHNIFDPNSGSSIPPFSTGPMDLYVNQATGDDANDGLSAATALATLTEAETRIPLFLVESTHRVIVHIASGTYAPPICRPRILNANI